MDGGPTTRSFGNFAKLGTAALFSRRRRFRQTFLAAHHYQDCAQRFDKVAESTLKDAKQLEGSSEAAAEARVSEAGLVWRVVGRDGEMFAVTLDYSSERVNAVIDHSVVTEISVG
jgi:hypothetical protein